MLPGRIALCAVSWFGLGALLVGLSGDVRAAGTYPQTQLDKGRRDRSRAAGLAAKRVPSYAKDIAPILFKHCVNCHRPGQIAPFSLLTFDDAARHGRLIVDVTAKGLMPPWQPAHREQPGYTPFRSERLLSASEIATLALWARAEEPTGDLAHAPEPPAPPPEWQLGEPDLIVKLPAAFSVPASGPDLYRCTVVALPLPANRLVRAFEFRPSNRAVTHHALLFIDVSGVARKLSAEQKTPGAKDIAEPPPSALGYPCFGAPGFLPNAALGGWSPGTGAVQYPEGTAVTLRKGADLVVQAHYHPSGKAEEATGEIGLYFRADAPTRHVMDVGLTNNAIDIPAGDASYRIRDHFEIPVDVDAVGIIPHAHYLCRDMKGWAVLPDGRKKWLLWIRDWDFNWQEHYQYAVPIRLPAGTVVMMEFSYDNSAANPHNPNVPPRRVTWGFGSGDEMAGLHIQVIPVRESDIPELGQALWGKIMRMVGGKFYRDPQP